MLRLASLFLICLFLPAAAVAQVELIVRVVPGSPTSAQLAAQASGAVPMPGVARPEPVAAAATRPALEAFVLSFPDSVSYINARTVWAQRDGVLYVQPNHTYTLDGLAQPVVPDSLYHLDVIGARQAWPITQGHPDVRVGLIDTGVYLQHPDLQGQLWQNPAERINGIDDDGNGYIDDVNGYDFVDHAFQLAPGDVRDRDADPSDDPSAGGGRGHGTSVAGVIAASLAGGPAGGVAPGVKLVPLRAFGSDGRAQDDDIVAAVLYAADMGIEVLNLSFGDAYISPLMRDAIAYATTRGTVVVASAGNAGGRNPHYPSDYPDVLSVGWTDASGERRAGFAQYGLGLDLVAPGTGIFTTLLPPDTAAAVLSDLYGRRSGSSMAAPMVSAAAALLRSLDRSLSPAAIRAILTSTARDLGPAGWDEETAAGLLRVDQALAAAFPARIELHVEHNSGVAAGSLEVPVTVLSPLLQEYTLSLRLEGTAPWVLLSEGMTRQVRQAVVARWETGAWAEGAYELRLAARLRNGQVVEDIRRVFLDRTAPDFKKLWLGAALREGQWGVFAEVQSDDLTEAVLTADTRTQTSDRIARRHGLWLAQTGLEADTWSVRLALTNRAGLSSDTTVVVPLPALGTTPERFEITPLNVPAGYLLDHATDFDGDGWEEIVFNRYQNGWLGDTLSVYEWNGTDFVPAEQVLANVFPRDTGDTDGDGRIELLTQVSAATLLIEYVPGEGLVDIAHIDSTALGDPTSEAAVFAARLTDLDGDGRGEILAHNTRYWKLLEWNGSAYVEAARLENPTPAGPSELGENLLQEPKALVGDFDGDGRMDLLTGDADGDLVMYEARGNDEYALVWTALSPRYDAGSRFAAGRFGHDGSLSFWTYTANWTGLRSDLEYEAATGLLYHWKATGDDAYVVIDSVLVASNASRHGALAALDVDGDGRDELALAHPPAIWVFSTADGKAHPLLYTTLPDPADAVRSIVLAASDFDKDGAMDLVFASADGDMHLLRSAAVPSVESPRFMALRFPSRERLNVSWRAVGVDSVGVYELGPSPTLLAVTADSMLVLPHGPTDRVLRLAGWRDGESSPLSAPIAVPGVPAQAVTIETATFEDGWLRVVFSGSIQHVGTDLHLTDGTVPERALLSPELGVLRLHFPTLSPGAHALDVRALTDHFGLPLASDVVAFDVPELGAAPLLLTAWAVVSPTQALLTFNAALDPSSVHAGAFRVAPEGKVIDAGLEAGHTDRVMVTVQGPALGATGQSTTVVVEGLRGAAGERLGTEGHVATLSTFAEDLGGVYLFPNPLRLTVHASSVTVAGLPHTADVAVLTLDGTLVIRLLEVDGDGGLQWDLRDRAGRHVPSGVYLVRVTAPGQEAVLLKLAVFR